MHNKSGTATQTAPAGAATANGDVKEETKSKRGGARKIPDGQTVVKFLLPTAEYQTLAKMADDEDRQPVDLARVIVRAKVRQAQQAQPVAASA